MPMSRLASFSALLLLFLPACAAQPGVEYLVHLDRARNQIIRVEATVENPGASAEFILPVWRPGRYGVLDFAANVRTWDATDGSGNALEVGKIRKNAWVVDSEGADRVTFGYDLFTNELGLRTRHADDSHVFLNGSSIFVMHPPSREAPHVVRFEGLGDWAIATGLEEIEPGVLQAGSFDVLVDSPIEIGQHRSIEFEVGDVAYEIAIWGEADKSDETLREDFTRIIEACVDIFEDVHFDRYVFLVHSYEGGGGGTEHLNSTIMQTRPGAFTSDSSYRGFLGLVAHEFFHTWNVKNFRPATLTPYDYDKENYTKLLWVAEGSTSYYDDLILARTGQRTVDNYLNAVAGSIGSVRGNPGRKMTSVEQSSYDAWLKFWGVSSPDHRNTNVNFYTQGHIISLALDMLIRRESGGERSYDDVMRLMNERYPLSTGGYTPEQFMDTVSEVAGTDMSEFFDRYVAGTETMPLEDLFTVVGLELVRDSDDEEPFTGLDLRDQGGKAIITRVYDESPAFEAGFNLDDEIVSVEGERVTAGIFRDFVEDASIGDTLMVGMFRRGKYREVELKVAGRVDERYSLEFIDDPSESQREAFESWIQQPWPGDEN